MIEVYPGEDLRKIFVKAEK